MQVASYKDLSVWQKSMNLVAEIYNLTDKLPKDENFGLKSQLRRSSVSIPSNIAEGSRRGTRTDFRHFCTMALGSTAEVETQLLLVKRLYPETVNLEAALTNTTEVQMMLSGLSRSLKSKS